MSVKVKHLAGLSWVCPTLVGAQNLFQFLCRIRGSPSPVFPFLWFPNTLWLAEPIFLGPLATGTGISQSSVYLLRCLTVFHHQGCPWAKWKEKRKCECNNKNVPYKHYALPMCVCGHVHIWTFFSEPRGALFSNSSMFLRVVGFPPIAFSAQRPFSQSFDCKDRDYLRALLPIIQFFSP